jgi:anti-sigma-K factor RskA
VQHCTPEQLALAALREPLPDADTTHLATCERCRDEVASLQRAVDALAVPELASPGAPVAPPPRVWESIAAATGVSAVPRADVLAAAGDDRLQAPAAPATERPAATDASVLPLRSRRRFALLAAAAAVAGAVVGAGAVAVLDRDAPTPNAVPVAAVDLDPLADSDASGHASVIERPDGTRVLEVDLRADDLEDRYYEVWLIDEAVHDMVPLGVTRSGTVDFELPDGLDLGRFPVVDVSVEPLDGNPTHSGISVARGVLDT